MSYTLAVAPLFGVCDFLGFLRPVRYKIVKQLSLLVGLNNRVKVVNSNHVHSIRLRTIRLNHRYEIASQAKASLCGKLFSTAVAATSQLTKLYKVMLWVWTGFDWTCLAYTASLLLAGWQATRKRIKLPVYLSHLNECLIELFELIVRVSREPWNNPSIALVTGNDLKLLKVPHGQPHGVGFACAAVDNAIILAFHSTVWRSIWVLVLPRVVCDAFQ